MYDMYVCLLLTHIKRKCYTVESKIMKKQMSKKRTQYKTQKHILLEDKTN